MSADSSREESRRRIEELARRVMAALALLAAPLAAQTPSPPAQTAAGSVAAQTPALQPQTAAAPQDNAGKFGFTYRLPGDWQVIAGKPQSAPQPPKPTQPSTSGEVRKGIACVEVPLTAWHGDPLTVIVVVALPFDCYGQTMTTQDLPGFGSAAEGLKQTFELTEPVTAVYQLSGHSMWIERAKATPKDKTAPVRTVEIACTVLKKSAVCWMAEAGDEDGLRAFENAPVTLDGDAAPALVPETAFAKTP